MSNFLFNKLVFACCVFIVLCSWFLATNKVKIDQNCQLNWNNLYYFHDYKQTVYTDFNSLTLHYFEKVKFEMYDFGDTLLLVSSDRISAFDEVIESGIPNKGQTLTELSNFVQKIGHSKSFYIHQS